MTQSPSDPELQLSELLAEYDEALATAADVSTVSSQPFVTHLEDAELLERFDRVQACLQLLDQDRRRRTASAASGGCQSPDWSDGDVQTSVNSGASGDSRPPLAEERSKIPRQIGRFRVIRKLGSGGFGVVFLAEDPVLRRQVAIKMPLASIFQSQELHARFLRECRAAAKLDHPGIVRVLESGDVQGIPYQVAEFVDGERLSDLLRREKLSARSAAVMVRSLADALQHAHDHGVLHRDIKPDNILLQRLPIAALQQQAEDATADQSALPTIIRTEPVPRITDFGLARVSDDDTALSRSGTLVGTPKYMSPEQLKGQTAAHGPQSDIYSLGVVLYELLTGTVPFLEAVTLQSRIAVSDKSVAPFRSGKAGISKDLETICLKCLQLRPGDRYQSAGELRDDLARYLDGRPTLARPIPVYEQFFRWVAGNRVLAAMLGTVVLSILVVTIQAIRNDRATRGQNATLSSTLSQLTKEKQRADESLTLANTNRIAAEQSETRFRDIAWLAQQGEYSTGIMQASAAWQRGEIASMNNVIARFRPFEQSNANASQLLESEICGFEWHYLWNQGRTNRPWTGHSQSVKAIKFTDGGEYGYSISDDDSIRRWHVASGRLLSTWRLDGDSVNVMAEISEDCSRAVISRRLDKKLADDVTVWDLGTGAIVMRREFPLLEIDAIAISSDGRVVVIGGKHQPEENSFDPFAQVWMPDTDNVIKDESTFLTLTDEATPIGIHTVSKISFLSAANEIMIAVQAGYGPLRDWHHRLLHVSLDLADLDKPRASPAAFRVLGMLPWNRGTVDYMCLSDDGKCLALIVRSDRFTADVWDLENRNLLQLPDTLDGKIDCVAFDSTGSKLGIGLVVPGVTPDGNPAKPGDRIATPATSEFRFWDFKANTSGTLLSRIKREVTFLQPLNSADGWIVGDAGGLLNLWQPNAVAPFRELPGHRPKETWDLALSSDGSTVFSVGDDHCLRSWDVASGVEKKSSIPRSILLSCVAVSPDGRWIAAGGYDDLVVVYDVETLNSVATLSGHTHDLRSLSFAPNSRLLATGGRDKTIRLWNVPGFDLAGTREGHGNAVRALTWTTDGQLYSSDSAGKILAWDSNGRITREHTEPEGVHSLAFAPTGLRIPAVSNAAVSNDAAKAGSPSIPTMIPKSASENDSKPSVLTIQSNELLAMGMNHGTVRLWHLPTNSVLFEAQHPGVEIRSIAFSPDGSTLAVAGSDDAVYLWHVATGRNVLTFDQLGAAVNRVVFTPDGTILAAALHNGSIRLWHAPNDH